MVRIVVEIPNDGGECKEWAIVELQGDLETRHPVPLNNNFIGDLHFTHKDAPVLIIGHHILQGKVISLEKPLAVIAKCSGAKENSAVPEDGEMGHSQSPNSSSYHVQAIIKRKILFKTRPKPIIAHVPKKL
ncbi:Chromosome transmission fidelity protein 8 [Bulinus truncatus]|nr:Chromosome transmission fidelity protein 8 [Bulinus truncatus]